MKAKKWNSKYICIGIVAVVALCLWQYGIEKNKKIEDEEKIEENYKSLIASCDGIKGYFICDIFYSPNRPEEIFKVSVKNMTENNIQIEQCGRLFRVNEDGEELIEANNFHKENYSVVNDIYEIGPKGQSEQLYVPYMEGVVLTQGTYRITFQIYAEGYSKGGENKPIELNVYFSI